MALQVPSSHHTHLSLSQNQEPNAYFLPQAGHLGFGDLSILYYKHGSDNRYKGPVKYLGIHAEGY